MEVRRININTDDCTLSLEDIKKAVSISIYISNSIFVVYLLLYFYICIALSCPLYYFFQIDHRTVMVAIGAASNACGTINPIKEISKYAKKYKLMEIHT